MAWLPVSTMVPVMVRGVSLAAIASALEAIEAWANVAPSTVSVYARAAAVRRWFALTARPGSATASETTPRSRHGCCGGSCSMAESSWPIRLPLVQQSVSTRCSVYRYSLRVFGRMQHCAAMEDSYMPGGVRARSIY